MKMKLKVFAALLAGVLLAPCVGAQSDTAIVLAEKEGVNVTTRDLVAELRDVDQNAQQEILKNPAEQLRPIILRVLTRKQMAAIAHKKGYASEPDVVAQLRQVEEELLAQLAVQRELANVVIPDQTEAATQYYKDNPQAFTRAAEVQLQQIALKTSDAAEQNKRLPEMQKILEQLTAGADFSTLAAQYSEDETKITRGNMGWVRKGRLLPEVEAAAFELKPGEVSQIVRSPYGLHLVKVLRRVDEGVQPFAAVKDDLIAMKKDQYLKKYMQDWIDKEAPSSAVFSDEAIKAAAPRVVELIADRPQ